MRITSVATTYQEPKTTLAEQLKKLRQVKGHPTARGFAKTLGISENRYSRYERGEAVPKLDLVWAICSTLGITPNELYGWEMPSEYARPVSRLAGMPVPSLPAPSVSTVGMADDPAPFVHQTQPTSSATGTVAWRLATVLAEAIESPGDTKLRTMRRTADIFSHLKADPFQTIAAYLQTIDLASSKPTLEARIAAEVEAFLAALGTNDTISDTAR